MSDSQLCYASLPISSKKTRANHLIVKYNYNLILHTYIIMSTELSCMPTSDSRSISPSLNSVLGLEYPNRLA